MGGNYRQTAPRKCWHGGARVARSFGGVGRACEVRTMRGFGGRELGLTRSVYEQFLPVSRCVVGSMAILRGARIRLGNIGDSGYQSAEFSKDHWVRHRMRYQISPTKLGKFNCGGFGIWQAFSAAPTMNCGPRDCLPDTLQEVFSFPHH